MDTYDARLATTDKLAGVHACRSRSVHQHPCKTSFSDRPLGDAESSTQRTTLTSNVAHTGKAIPVLCGCGAQWRSI